MPHPITHPRSLLLWLAACLALSLSACTSGQGHASPRPAGTLLAIGGALEDDNAAVYQRFVALARPGGRIVIATAASADEPDANTTRRAILAKYAPGAPLDTISRTTPDADAARIIDQARAIFFTGGDQKRIADLYRPGGQDTQASHAMRRLLSRGGVIAGTSAGEAMMSDPMFLTGRSTEALGLTSTKPPAPDEDTPRRSGPQIGTGMGLEPWVIVDSHFFERDRFGRLVAALEASGRPLGLGVGENACVEIDLATARASCVGDVPSLLVDVRHLSREGLARRGVATRLLARGDHVTLDRVEAPGSGPAIRHPGDDASWSNLTDGGSRAFFRAAAELPCIRHLDAYRLAARPSSGGWAIVDIIPAPPKGH